MTTVDTILILGFGGTDSAIRQLFPGRVKHQRCGWSLDLVLQTDGVERICPAPLERRLGPRV